MKALRRRELLRAAKPRLQEFGDFGKGRVADHYGVEPLARRVKHQVHEGNQVALENLFPGMLHDGKTTMRVNGRTAKAGKMFAAADDAPDGRSEEHTSELQSPY